jgi:hypothetical protein
MDANPLFSYRDVSEFRINPSARVVVIDPVAALAHGGVRVPAEDAVKFVCARVSERALRHFRRHAQEARVQPVDAAAQRVAFEIEFLERKKDKCP